MELLTVSSTRNGVIVVVDANRNKENADALEWAINHVVRPRDIVLFLGVLRDFGKRNYSCFPLMSNISIFGVREKLEFLSGNSEVNPRQLGEELERKRVQFQSNLEKFHRQCKRNEVKLEVKLAAGYCPAKITVDEARNSNTRLIVIDSYLKKYQGFISDNVECNVAIMKGKDFATLMPSKKTKTFSPKFTKTINEGVAIATNGKNPEKKQDSSTQQVAAPTPQTPSWYPLSWRSGFPRAFSLREVEEMTDGFAGENLLEKSENLNIYEGIFQETPVVITCLLEEDDRFWRVLIILSRVRHRNIMNFVGYCCTGSSRVIISDFPCLGTVASNLNDDNLAKQLTWKARWYIAIEIGGSLRYLHEECGDRPIVHHSICSNHIVFSQGGSAMLCNFLAARCLDIEKSSAEGQNSEKEENLYVDVRDYGVFLVELISGQNAKWYAEENEGQSLVDLAVPLIKDGKLNQIMDSRLSDSNSDSKVIEYMAKAALLCLRAPHSLHPPPSISEVLAVVRGDRLAISKWHL